MICARFRASTLRALIAGVAGVMTMFFTAGGASAQEQPRYGGELVFVVPPEPASYDAHREGTFALVHPLAPVYSTLLRFDPFDRTGTKVVGDLAELWTVSKDGLRDRSPSRANRAGCVPIAPQGCEAP